MIKIANAPCSRGVLEFDLGMEKQPDTNRFLMKSRETGYEGC